MVIAGPQKKRAKVRNEGMARADNYQRAPGGFGAGNVRRNELTPVDPTVRDYLDDDTETTPRKTITLACGYTYDQNSATLYIDGKAVPK